MVSYNFSDIVDVQKWQKIQDHFSEVLGITLRTIDKRGNFITGISGNTRLCDEVIRKSRKAIEECERCLPPFNDNLDKNWKDGYLCPLGFYNFLVPLKLGEESLAYIVVGPVILGKRYDYQRYIELAKEFNLDPEEYLDALRDIKISSFYGIKSIIELLYDIGTYICRLGYQNKRLRSIAPELPDILNRVHSFYVEKLLSALLDISYNFTEAERGSIMLLDEKKNELYIKVARGINKEIVDNVKLKVGDGIAGVIVQREKPIFIDDNIKDAVIRERLKNPKLKYSILIPIKIKNTLVGVLNIATSKKVSPKFTPQSMGTVDKLTQLVGATLTDLPHSISQ